MLKVLDNVATEVIIGGMNDAGLNGGGGSSFVGPVQPVPTAASGPCVVPKSYPDFSTPALPVARPSDGHPVKSIEEINTEREQADKIYSMWTELYEGLRGR
jgi:hypothetical protein